MAAAPVHPDMILCVRFYRTESGKEPVREWLKELPKAHRTVIGEDIKTVQFGWPIGMPVVRKLGMKLWEVRSRRDDGIVRIMFTFCDNQMILLHGFIKKSQHTPPNDLETARNRMRQLLGRHA